MLMAELNNKQLGIKVKIRNQFQTHIFHKPSEIPALKEKEQLALESAKVSPEIKTQKYTWAPWCHCTLARRLPYCFTKGSVRTKAVS